MQLYPVRAFWLCAGIFSIYIILHFSLIDGNIYSELKSGDINLIIGATRTTQGTDREDVIIGCSSLVPECSLGDLVYAKEGNDVVQGSSADDNLYGDEGKDEITGGDGNDELYGGPNNDVLQAGIGGDFLVGGPGNDELYSGVGDDVLIGGRGADFFDCGDGQDTIVDFSPAKGDTQAGNCEVSFDHQANNIGSHLENNQVGIGDVRSINPPQSNAVPDPNGIEMLPLPVNRH